MSSRLHRFPRASAAAAALLAAALAAGCAPPLARQHGYFASPSDSAARAGAQARHTLNHHHALQAVRRACAAPMPDAAPLPPGPDLGRPAARAALAGICVTAAARTVPVSTHGAASNAYRRWVEDRVRELPAPSETAASAAGGG